MKAVWPDSFVSEDSLTQSIWALRRALGDHSSQPSFVATVPRRGYRFVAAVTTGFPSAGDGPGAAGTAALGGAPRPSAGGGASAARGGRATIPGVGGGRGGRPDNCRRAGDQPRRRGAGGCTGSHGRPGAHGHLDRLRGRGLARQPVPGDRGAGRRHRPHSAVGPDTRNRGDTRHRRHRRSDAAVLGANERRAWLFRRWTVEDRRDDRRLAADNRERGLEPRRCVVGNERRDPVCRVPHGPAVGAGDRRPGHKRDDARRPNAASALTAGRLFCRMAGASSTPWSATTRSAPGPTWARLAATRRSGCSTCRRRLPPTLRPATSSTCATWR